MDSCLDHRLFRDSIDEDERSNPTPKEGKQSSATNESSTPAQVSGHDTGPLSKPAETSTTLATRKLTQIQKFTALARAYREYTHWPRTLDEFHYPELLDHWIDDRNKSQILTKYMEEKQKKLENEKKKTEKNKVGEQEKTSKVIGKDNTEKTLGQDQVKESAVTQFQSPQSPMTNGKTNTAGLEPDHSNGTAPARPTYQNSATQRYHEQDLKTEDRNKDPLLLTVPQLWLWIIDEHTIITAFSERNHHSGANGPMLARLNSGVQAALEECQRLKTEPTTYRLAIQITNSWINFIDYPDQAGLSESIFSIIDKQIGKVSDQATRDLKTFRLSLEKRRREKISINNEVNNLDEMRHIRDQISIIQAVLQDQIEVWDEAAMEFAKYHIHMTAGPEGESYGDRMNRQRESQLTLVRETAPRVSKLIRRLGMIDKSAQAIEDDINHLLDIKQKEAALEDAQSSSTQNAIIFVFTAVTIVYTPAAFITGFFALSGDISLARFWKVTGKF